MDRLREEIQRVRTWVVYGLLRRGVYHRARRRRDPLAPRNDEMFSSGDNMQTELNKVVTALQEFYAHETYLFEKDLGERTLTHRLAVHLEKHFPGWNVDCDYNRLGERTLRLPHGTMVSTDGSTSCWERTASYRMCTPAA